MLKKWLSLGLCVMLLLSLTACGGEQPQPNQPEDENYVAGMAKLEEGKWQEAYDLFKLSADPRAAEMLEKFVFVPTTVIRKNSTGRDLVHTFTYDEKGNLLSDIEKGDDSWTMETDNAVTYTYDEMGNMLSRESRYKDEMYRTVYTYDEKGNELTYTYYNTSGDFQNSYTNTYDERGRLAKTEHYDHLDAAHNYTEVFTYDEQDRVLTCTITYADREPTVYTYVYAEDGSYQKSYNGSVYAYTYWYDKEGRTVKHEVVNTDTNEVQEYSETRYDERGHQVYYCEEYYGSGYSKTTTYNEQGLELTSQSFQDGELYSMTASTYDEKGNELTYEYSYGNTAWGRVTYTYDEQNRLLTKKSMSNTEWYQNTLTYDEAGNCIKVDHKGSSKSGTYDYTYDQWGNVATCVYYGENVSGELASNIAVEWALQYYPEEVPTQVDSVLTDVKYLIEW